MSAASVLEAAIVVDSELGDPGARELDLLLYNAGITVVPFSPEHLPAARHAFRVLGKGRHAAALNFGDCFSYALSTSTGEPLLFEGVDFPRTEVSRHLLP
jgi:ribonuclease VapC